MPKINVRVTHEERDEIATLATIATGGKDANLATGIHYAIAVAFKVCEVRMRLTNELAKPSERPPEETAALEAAAVILEKITDLYRTAPKAEQEPQP